VLPDAKLHRPRDYIYFRKLLRACRFKSYRIAAKALGLGRRTVAEYGRRGGFPYTVQFYLECRAAMQNEMESSAVLAPASRLGCSQ
jgi:hypothetical protein